MTLQTIALKKYCCDSDLIMSENQHPDLIINWNTTNKTHLKLEKYFALVSTVSLGFDIWSALTDPSSSISHESHWGGFIFGMLIGIVCFRSLEETWFHRNVMFPLALFACIGLFSALLFRYIQIYPSEVSFSNVLSSLLK